MVKPFLLELDATHIVVTVSFDETSGEYIGGSVQSNLRGGSDPRSDDQDEWNRAVDAVEYVVLSHAAMGIDVGAKPYVDGIAAAVRSLCDTWS